MCRGKFTFLVVIAGCFNVFAQSESIAGVDLRVEQRSEVSSAINNSSIIHPYNSLDAVIHVIPWKKEINRMMDAIDRSHFTPRTLEDLNQVLINGTFNSFDDYPSLAQDERDHLELKFRVYFSHPQTSYTGLHHSNTNSSTSYAPVSRNDETGQIQVDENYFTWLEEHVFRHSKAHEIFQREQEVYKYAALFNGIAQMLDPNSWFAFDSKSYARAANLIEGQTSAPVQQLVYYNRSSVSDVFSQNYSFGRVNLNNRVLWVSFKEELGHKACDSLLTILSEYEESYDSVVYDFRQTLGGTRPEFEHLLEPFVALEGYDVLMASFFDRHGYESLPERMLIRHQDSQQRAWKQEALNKTLLVYTSPISSSGAEIVAMTVQDLGLGVILGQKSSGKTTSAESYMIGPLAFWLTEYKYFGPKGNSPKGIKPDLELYLENENSYVRNYDKQFAINYPLQLTEAQLLGVYANNNLWTIDLEQKRTAIQEAVRSSFLKNKSFKNLLKAKDSDQDELIRLITTIVSEQCQRDQLNYACDVEGMSAAIESYFYEKG